MGCNNARQTTNCDPTFGDNMPFSAIQKKDANKLRLYKLKRNGTKGSPPFIICSINENQRETRGLIKR